MAILTELRDPRVKDVTVISVEVAPDMREAKVRVSILGDETKQELSLRGLQNSTGFLQSRIADRIETRYIPKLRFVLDKGLQNALAVGEILDQIRREREAREGKAASDAPPHAAEGDTLSETRPQNPDPTDHES